MQYKTYKQFLNPYCNSVDPYRWLMAEDSILQYRYNTFMFQPFQFFRWLMVEDSIMQYRYITFML